MAAIQTIYEDLSGNKKTGYLIGGKTYQDEQGLKPVDVGSVVNTADGRTWYKGQNGSVDVTNNAGLLNELRSGIQATSGAGALAALYQQQLAQGQQQAENSLQKAQEAQDALIRAKTEAAVARLQAQVDPLNQGYDAQKKTNYRGYVRGQDGLREQLVQAGLGTSGAAESSRVGLETGYLETQNSVEAERQNALQALALEIETARQNGDYQAAETMANYYQQLSALQQNATSEQLNALLTQYQLQREEDETAWQRAQAAQQWEYQRERDTIEDTRYEDETAYERAQAALAAARAAESEDTASAVDRFESGDQSDEVIAQLLSEGYTRAQIEAAGYRGNYFTKLEAATPTADDGGTKLAAATFNRVANEIGELVSAGRIDRARELYDEYVDELSEAQDAIIKQIVREGR